MNEPSKLVQMDLQVFRFYGRFYGRCIKDIALPKRATHLNDRQIRSGLKASPKGVAKYADGHGLYLNVSEGGRWWSWRGTVHGRRVEFGVGALDLVPPIEARKIALDWQRVAREGGDPRQARDAAKGKKITFEEVARLVWERDVNGVAKNAKARDQWINSLKTYAFPRIGKRAIHGVTRSDVEAVLSPIWREKPETARRVRQRMNAVFAAAIGKGYFEGANPVDKELSKALGQHTTRQKHHAAVHFRDLPDVYHKIASGEGNGSRALAFTILTAARSGEVRGMTWDELDLEAGVWTVPEERMKAGREHTVPLSPQALALLVSTPRMKDENLVFPGTRQHKPMSDATMAAVLKRLGIAATVHGFRSTFRDWAEVNTNASHAAKELSLAHVNKDRVEAAYLRDGLLDQRRELLDEWARFATGE